MRFVRLAVIAAALVAVPFATQAHAQDADNHLSPEQRAAKKNAAVNAAYERVIKDTAPLTKETPNNDPWSNMRSPTANTAKR